ncbi:UBA domain-containing protein 7 [Ceratobasidium sp. AG-Ba]|nr:UBA domain-containing protein 7 [Ceratobasidium sp. AG-Ba]
MSDFSDLWNSGTPPAKQPDTIGSLSKQIPAPNRNGGLSVPQAGSRSGTPSYLSANTLSPQINTQSFRPSSRTSGTTPVSALNSSKTDAFGDLFSLSGDSHLRNMTIAERKAQADRERVKAEEESKKERDAHGAFWDLLEFGGSGGSQPRKTRSFSGIAAPIPQAQTTRINTSMLAPSSISPVPSQPSASKASAVTNTDPWDLDSFLAPSQSVSQIATPVSNLSPVQKSAPRNADLFDLFDSSSVQPAQPSGLPGHTPVRSNTPGDFDWGDREDQDDLLGELSKPVSEVSRASARSPAVEHQSSRPAPAGRASSPPPHILGQIVEMGFSIQQAKRALANTSTGTDVQAALESLLGSQSGANDDSPAADDLERFREEDAAARREHEEAERRRRRRAGPSRSEVLQKASEEPTSQIQERADQLLAQASIIGASMFNRANAFWKEGKEKALKAYEERAAAGGSSPQPRQGGRPAWMRDEEPAFSEHSDDRAASHAGFRDEDGDDPVPPRPQAQQPRRTVAQAQSSQPVSTAPVPQRPADKLASLFSDTTTYVSPSRRKPPSQIPTPVQPSPVERRPVSPLPAPRVRTNPPVSASALAAAQVHRTKGTDAFKLGQFGAAVDAYSAAIDLLPEGHISLIPLLNNRAAARAKAGDATGAVEDCTAVLGAIGDDYDPKREAPIPDVDLSAALLKALRRRAEVLESTEKWRRAREDWERLVKVGGTWAGSKAASDGVQGVGRCKRMEDGGNQPPARPSAVAAAAKPKPRPRPKPTSSGLSNTDDSAVRRLKEATAAAEAEGEEKHALKDSVDARVMAWKGGKEANIRALIASLDTYYGPSLYARTCDAQPSQNQYVRAIAKVHPDKLNTSVTTVEQRMIANSVFGALNEAWNAFAQ